MAAQLHAAEQFRTVQIFKTQSLGLGSYGAVYKAKADQLPCAAKLLHPILFQDKDPGARRIQQRFEQECQFLSAIRHPNIVQYLGTSTDCDSGLPALLMELMDESLTHFLETSQQPLPYHLEVNLSHDIALALDYLHSNGIIHRDLSSNNVLLIAGSRAKVTDFGMSKLLDTALHATPQTQCPGTMSYMSPEALRTPPVYSKKLDCFSFGVLGIQIMTRQFPRPGPAKQIVDDPRSPIGTTEMPVLEPKRRKKHIDLIAPNHPLLSTALRCLEYHERNRPSAQELCDQLATLKESPQYTQSVQQSQERVKETEKAATEIERLRINLAVCETEIRDLQQKLQQERDRLQQELRANEQVTSKFQKAILQQQRQNEQITAQFQQTILQQQQQIHDLQKTVLVDGESKEPINKEENPQAKATRNFAALKWELRKSPPEDFSRLGGESAADCDTVYLRSVEKIYTYFSPLDEWSRLPDCPQTESALVVMNGLLTAVGGERSGNITNTLTSLVGEGRKKKWIKRFPPMPTARLCPAVVCSGQSLVAAGGMGVDKANCLSTVEVMDTDVLQWFTACSLPHPFLRASATICGGDLYMMGGHDANGITKSVLKCSLAALISSGRKPRPHKQMQDTLLLTKDRTVWSTVADIPLYLTTCTTLCGQLLAFGGQDDRFKSFDSVYKYNKMENTWSLNRHIPMTAYSMIVESLSGDKLLVCRDKFVYIVHSIY